MTSQDNVVLFPIQSAAHQQRQRLQSALSSLQGAVAEQKQALSDWRFAMAELGIGVAGLGQALIGYQDSLGTVETQLHGLRCSAAELRQQAG